MQLCHDAIRRSMFAVVRRETTTGFALASLRKVNVNVGETLEPDQTGHGATMGWKKARSGNTTSFNKRRQSARGSCANNGTSNGTHG